MKIKFISIYSAILVAVSACGGGGGSGAVSLPAAEAATIIGPAGSVDCGNAIDQDALGSMKFFTVHPINAKPYGCTIVSKDSGNPVESGNKSIRFEVDPGDCSSNAGFNDCTNDRSRHEIQEAYYSSTNSSTIVFETKLFIPKQLRFRPKGDNYMTLIQLVTQDPNGYYSIMSQLNVNTNGDLMVRTHKDFTFDIRQEYPAYTNPYEKWITIRYEIYSTTGSNGSLKVFVDGVLKVDETRITLPNPNAWTNLRIGIYNSFMARATEAYDRQVIYFDSIVKSFR